MTGKTISLPAANKAAPRGQAGLLVRAYRFAERRVRRFLRRATHAAGFAPVAKCLSRTARWLRSGSELRLLKRRPSPGVTVVGYFRMATGVAEIARQSVYTAMRRGVPVSYVDLPAAGASGPDVFCGLAPRGVEHDTNLLHVNADSLPRVVGNLGSRFFASKRNIGVWFWEMSSFPSKWHESFELLDELWVASRFTIDAMRRVSPVPVWHFRPVIRPSTLPPDGHRRAAFPDSKYVFLFLFDLLSIVERKNPSGVIEAYRRAFGRRSPDTALVLKVNNIEVARQHRAHLGLTREVEDRLMAAIDDVSGILISESMSRRETHSLIAQCDCYVSLHRSEGLGLTLAEAMYYGKPCIATSWSGNMDFMTPMNSYLVDCHPVPLTRDHGPYRQGWTWAEPDLDHAAQLMRRVVENREEAGERGGRAAAEIRSRYGIESAGQEMLERLRSMAGTA